MTFALFFQTLLTWVYSLFASLFILRAWGLAVRMPSHATAFNRILRVTDPVVGALNRLLRNPRPVSLYQQGGGVLEWVSLLVAYLIIVFGLILVYGVLGGGFYVLLAFLNGIFGLLNLFFTLAVWILVISAILSWVNPTVGIYLPMQMLLAPLLAPIRRFVPTVGILDFSYLVLLIVLQLAQYGLFLIKQQLFLAFLN